MKLVSVHVTEFQSIQDSSEFEIDDITCLVGKNESGKTALLKALYRLNPVQEVDDKFDVIDDYPRSRAAEYLTDVESGRREPANVVRAEFKLEPEDISAVEEVFGPSCLVDESPSVTLFKGYSNEIEVECPDTNAQDTFLYLVLNSGLSSAAVDQVYDSASIGEMLEKLISLVEQEEHAQKLADLLMRIADDGLSYVVYDEVLDERVPKFLYFDEYYLMNGQENLEAFKRRAEASDLQGSDFPLLGLIQLAGIDLDELINPVRTEALFSRLEAAGNILTQGVLRHWSQNRHLRMKFEIHEGRPADPPGMTGGRNIWWRVEDTRQYVTTSFGTRASGFIWFFSFLAWYSYLSRRGDNVILLLDEPGLSLHAKAQGDLLQYFESELKPHHQVIYTTHSPFMVDSTRFDRVRIVQDLSIDSDWEKLPEGNKGTIVTKEALEVAPDSLFPLQGALGYEIYQTLFVGPNSLIVEGPSDLLYIKAVSSILERRGEQGLSSDWTITPVGGSDKVPTFVALMGAQSNLNVAVLIDYQKNGMQSIENLYKKRLIKESNILTFADFVQGEEADIEDMFSPQFYLKLVNEEFGSSISEDALHSRHPRILVRIESYLESCPLPNGQKFNHYRPARYFTENIDKFESDLTVCELNHFREAFAALNGLL